MEVGPRDNAGLAHNERPRLRQALKTEEENDGDGDGIDGENRFSQLLNGAPHPRRFAPAVLRVESTDSLVDWVGDSPL